MAAGAPLGIWLESRYGLESIGAAAVGISVLNLALALPLAGVPIVRGAHLAFSRVLGRVGLHGLGLTLGTVGFAAIASFTGLYYSSRHWTDPGLALILFGSGFIVTRLLFAGTINRWGGFRVAIVSFIVESAGLFVLWSATTHDAALAGAALSGCGFALVFPALGVEAIKTSLTRITGLHSGCIPHFSICRWALQARLQDLLSGRSVTRRFSSMVQELRAARLCLLFSSTTWFVIRMRLSRGRHSSRWKRGKSVGFVIHRMVVADLPRKGQLMQEIAGTTPGTLTSLSSRSLLRREVAVAGTRWLPIVLVFGSIGAVAYADFIVTGVSLGYLYIFPLGISAMFLRSQISYGLIAVCVFLHDLFGPPYPSQGARITHNLTALIAFAFVVYVIRRYVKQREQLERPCASSGISFCKRSN